MVATSSTLNEELTIDGISTYVQRSFRGPIKKVLLKPGTPVFTLTSRSNKFDNAGAAVTEWWSPARKLQGDPGLPARMKFAEDHNIELLEVMLDTGAYANERKGLRYVVVGAIRKPVYGFFGRIRRQGRAKAQANAALGAAHMGASSNVETFTGYQLYIPNLKVPTHFSRRRSIDLMSNAATSAAAAAEVSAIAGPAAA